MSAFRQCVETPGIPLCRRLRNRGQELINANDRSGNPISSSAALVWLALNVTGGQGIEDTEGANALGRPC